ATDNATSARGLKGTAWAGPEQTLQALCSATKACPPLYDRIEFIEFSYDGTHIITLSALKNVGVWNLSAGGELHQTDKIISRTAGDPTPEILAIAPNQTQVAVTGSTVIQNYDP
ncbi:hypothetical protein FRC11_001306, partial [Ceratobasidium sp. 423]